MKELNEILNDQIAQSVYEILENLDYNNLIENWFNENEDMIADMIRENIDTAFETCFDDCPF